MIWHCPAASVHDATPPANWLCGFGPVQTTAPVGVIGDAIVSVTVAVQVDGEPSATVEGAQLIKMDVDLPRTV